jgi:hypothetical protein
MIEIGEIFFENGIFFAIVFDLKVKARRAAVRSPRTLAVSAFRARLAPGLVIGLLFAWAGLRRGLLQRRGPAALIFSRGFP